MKKILLGLLCTLSYFSAFAGEPKSEALPFVQLDFSPASLAMGSTRIASAAVLPLQDNVFRGGVFYQNYMPDFSGTKYIGAGAAGKYQDFGVSFAFTRGTGEEISSPEFTPTEILVNLGAAYGIGNFAAGLNVKYAKERILSDYSHSAIAADIFAAYRSGGFDIAGGISSIGQKVESESTGEFGLPSATSLCGGYTLGFGKHTLGARARADYFFSGSISAGAGVEYCYSGMILARGGYHYGGDTVIPSFASAGLGLCFAGFTFDAAYLFASDVLGGTFAISAGVKF